MGPPRDPRAHGLVADLRLARVAERHRALHRRPRGRTPARRGGAAVRRAAARQRAGGPRREARPMCILEEVPKSILHGYVGTWNNVS